MNFKHEEIREMFPEYLKGSLSEELRDKIEEHLKECSVCRSELSMMSELISINAPDPGNLFWETLPQKVKGLVEEDKTHHFSIKSLLVKFVPAAAVISILLVFILTVTKKNGLYELDPYFDDPFTTISYPEYNDIDEEDISLLTEQTVGEELYIESEDFMGYSYHREFASLSSEELNSLYKALETEQKIGG